jgi:hypothetical protein
MMLERLSEVNPVRNSSRSTQRLSTGGALAALSRRRSGLNPALPTGRQAELSKM